MATESPAGTSITSAVTVGNIDVVPSYVGTSANGQYTFTATRNGRTVGPDNGANLTAALHVPTGSTSPGTAAFFDPVTPPARQYCFGGVSIPAPGLQPGQGPFTATSGEWDDATADSFGEDAETGLSGLNIGAGLITGYDTDTTRNPVYPNIRHGLAFTIDQHLLKPNGTGVTSPTAPESVQGAFVTTVGPAIVDASGELFTITSGAQVAVGGVADGTTSRVTTLLYWNHLVYQENADSNFYSKANAAATWVGPVADPRAGVVPAVTVNPSSWPARVQDTQADANLYLGNLTVGATLAIPSSTTMPGGLNANQQGLFWTMQHYPSIFRGLSPGGFGYRCDQVANTSQWVIDARAVLPSFMALLRPMRNQHQAGQSFTTNPKNGPGVRSDAGPPPLTPTSAGESVDGTSVTTVGPVINASRTPGSASAGPFDTFGLTANPGFIIFNGVADTVTSSNVIMLYYIGHKTYQQNNASLWWVWSGTAWVSTTDPRSVVPRNYLVGYRDGNPADTTTAGLLGYPWEYTINNAYEDNWGGASISGLAVSPHPGVSVIAAVYHLNNGSPPYMDPVVAANGGYNSFYTTTAQSLIQYAHIIHAVRIDHEFNGTWEVWSPFGGSGQIITAATWIAGWRNMAQAIRAALPNAKIVWNPNIGQNDPYPYYPGDDLVDIIGLDAYTQPAFSGGLTSAQMWQEYLTGQGGNNFTTLAAFGVSHNKPMCFPEWGDGFGDGVYITQFGAWMDQHNVVAHSYWDSADGLTNTTALTQLPQNQQAFVKAFGHRPYTGTYWPPL